MEKSPYLKLHIFILLLLIVFSFVPFSEQKQQEINNYIQIKANEFRSKNKKDSLIWNPCLNKAALDHALYLKTKKELSHFQDKKETYSPTDRVKLNGCIYKIVLENVAYIEYDEIPKSEIAADQLMQLWIKSKGHRNNLLSKFSKKMGTSVVFDEKSKRIIAVQVFTD